MRTRDWSTVDFYAILGVGSGASTDEIAVAFRTLAKQLHPDRSGASSLESERFKSVTAAYDVVGDARLRRSYDEVRAEATRVAAQSARTAVSTLERPVPVPDARGRVPLTADEARRRGRRWVAAGVAVFLLGSLVCALVLHLQIDEAARRAGRVKTEAVLLVGSAGNQVRFTTAAGDAVQVPEPTRVDPGTETDGQRIAVLYRPDRPTDVIIDESTLARDITLWIVAVKMLVGGVVFLVVGVRRLRYARRTAAL